ncbi:MAG: hypothetical protein ACT4OO_02930 [Nitrospiraceae bacterium]
MEPQAHQLSQQAAGRPKRRLDIVVKLGLGVLATLFALIWGGMFLSRPDRSIPPYSIGSQEGTAVAMHVPGWTSDSAIETLIERFRKIGHETRNFGPMKIRATTPGDAAGPYQRMTIYIFTHEAWAEPEILHRYLEGDPAVREGFDKALRGLYRLEDLEEEGRIGPLIRGKDTAGTAAYSRALFKGSMTSKAASESRAEPVPAP